MDKYDSLKSKKSDCTLFLATFITLFFIANIFKFSILGLLICFFISYLAFFIFSFRSVKSIKNVLLSAEFIFETVFFVYAVPAAVMFILDGYEPRINFFTIDSSTILETLKLYFNINSIFIILVILLGGVHTLNFYNREKDLQKNNIIKFDVFDAIALILVVYFYYLHFRNGLSIFGTYFHDLRNLIESSLHNFNSYIYLYMIPYSCVNIYKILYSQKNQLKIGTYKKIFTSAILILFWALSILTDRRNLIMLLAMLAIVVVYKLKKVPTKIIVPAIITVIVLLSISFFRSGTSDKSINNVVFLSLGEFVLTNYVSDYYISNDHDLKYGRTYTLDLITSFIPRSIFPQKPKMLSEEFKESAKTNVAYAFNPVAEGLVNFGKIGATIVVPLIMLLFVKVAYRLSKTHILFFAIICAESINFFRGIFAVSSFTIVVVSVFTFLMLKPDIFYAFKLKRKLKDYDDKNPKISVIMATYNTGREYLTQAIDSILAQTYKNFEFIIISDGPSDDLSVIREYKDDRIKIIEHQENKGLPCSLNDGIKIAKGKYIARMDSDDIAIKTRFEIQVKYLNKHPDISVCSMFCKKFGNEDCIEVLPYVKSKYLKIHLLFRNAIVHPLIMMRKDFLEKNNLLYNENYLCSQDYELWSRCIDYGEISIIPKLGLYYRFHNKQASTEKKEKQLAYYKQIVRKNLEAFKDFDFESNIENILLLFDGNVKIDMAQLIKLSNLIDDILAKNTKYNNKDLETVLDLKLFNIGLKSNLIFNNLFDILKDKSLRMKILRFSNCELNLKKVLYKLKCKYEVGANKNG